MSFIWYIIIGIVAGFLAGKIMRGGGFGLVINLLLGILGGVFVHTLPFLYSFCLFSVIKSLSFLFCIHSLECFFLMFLSFFLCLITCICLLSLR